MAYIPYTREQKQKYAKKFTKEQREAYLLGKRQGFLEGVHKPPKQEFMQHSKEELLLYPIFDDIDKVKLI